MPNDEERKEQSKVLYSTCYSHRHLMPDTNTQHTEDQIITVTQTMSVPFFFQRIFKASVGEIKGSSCMFGIELSGMIFSDPTQHYLLLL